ncbi:MAG: YraN family protein [Candidatus Moranbacteria bacterium]|nr:YraN family protein [Candidatus Moranbacteria bacterium]
MAQEKSSDRQTSRQTGQDGERVAANFLKSRGYRILDMNFQNGSGRRLGEIDIIAKDPSQNEIIFAEVKTREYTRYKNTLPEENINRQKLRKLDKIAAFYLKKNGLESCGYRFDALSVWLDYETRRAKIKHIPNIYLL